MLISLDKLFKKVFTDHKILVKAHKQKHNFLSKYCGDSINIEYLKELCNDTNNKILVYSLNENLGKKYKNEAVGILVYKILLCNSDKIRFYIPLISIHKNMRACGYGSLIFEEFIAKYKKNKTLELVLLSLQSSYNFYKKIGFEVSSVEYIIKNENIENCIVMSKGIK